MRTIKLQKSTLIRLVFAIFISISLLSLTFIYYSKTYVYPPPPAVPLYTDTIYYWGYTEFIYGGWIGLILIIVSVVLLSPERKKKAFSVGSLGCALIGIILVIRTFFQSFTIQPGFFVGFIFWIGLCVATGYAFLSTEGEVSFNGVKSTKISLPKIKLQNIKQIFKAKSGKMKEEEDSSTYWQNREEIIDETISYIKKKQLKQADLPFFKINSKTGIIEKDLRSVVKDLISKK